MKIGKTIIKLIIDFCCLPLKKNKSLRKYVYTVTLKDQTENYCANEFFQGYYHITKAIKIIKRFNIKEHTIVDVGGATGITARMFAQHFEKTKIWVFEPLEPNYRFLNILAKENKNLIIVPKAVGNKKEKTFINKSSRITSSSLYQLNNDEKSEIFSQISQIEGKEEIEITTLDDILPDSEIVSILKLDVQGYELEVLKGSNKILMRTVLIVLEMNNHDVYKGAPKYYELDSHLRNNNFVLFDIFPSLKDDEQLKEWDCIYVNKNYLR